VAVLDCLCATFPFFPCFPFILIIYPPFLLLILLLHSFPLFSSRCRLHSFSCAAIHSFSLRPSILHSTLTTLELDVRDIEFEAPHSTFRLYFLDENTPDNIRDTLWNLTWTIAVSPPRRQSSPDNPDHPDIDQIFHDRQNDQPCL